MLRRMERSAIHVLRKRGKSLRAIAAELGHSKTTIARALSEPVDQPSPRRQRVSQVDPWRSQIAEWLQQGLSGVRMLELARDDAEQPYRGVLRCGAPPSDGNGWRRSTSRPSPTSDSVRGLAGRVPAGRLGRDSPLPVYPSLGQAVLPGVSAEVQPLGVGALYDRYASGDAVSWVG